MLHPVGNLPPHMYWRRRLFLLAIPVVLVIVTLGALISGGGKRAAAQNTATTTTPNSAGTSSTPTSIGSASGPASTGSASTSAAPSDSSSISVTTATKTASPASIAATSGTSACAVADLSVTAGAAHKSFPVKSKPVLYMQLTDTAAKPCKLDVADKHVEWRVYSGDARFWGSHDCAVEAGTNVITLLPNRTVRLSIAWSGLTSVPGCKGTRLAVQAGTYTLYAYLNGRRSPAATFVIT